MASTNPKRKYVIFMLQKYGRCMMPMFQKCYINITAALLRPVVDGKM